MEARGAHAFSTYEAWGDADKTVFLKRGINSIQFFFDGANWKVVSMIWDDERPGLSTDRKCLTQDFKTMPKYLKRHWNEGRGDEYDSWGACWWFLEVDANGEVTRQAELYENGRLLRYSAAHPEDEFGALAEVSIDTSDADYAAMAQGDFEKIWGGS